MEIILGLGSNRAYMGNSPVCILAKAVNDLSAFISDIKLSSVYETKPMYVENQDNFYNIVLMGNAFNPKNMGDKGGLSPEDLLLKINEIEAKWGRNKLKEIRFGPRSIDIDIEETGDLVMDTAFIFF